MTDYRIAEEIANEIVNVHNAKYEALRGRDVESYERLFELEENLEDSLEKFGFEIFFEFDKKAPLVICGKNVALKVKDANIQRIVNDDYKCTVGYLQDLCDMG